MSDNNVMSQEQIEEMLRNAGQVEASAPAVDLNVNAYLSQDEQDALGEMGNICMGTAATTMYTLLGRKVMITTPSLSVHNRETLAAEHPLPLVVVEVQYTQGISGNNLLLLKEYDAALITDLLMGGSGNLDPNNIVLDEISLSAIREVMNQMVGSSATSLASMLHKTINISTPASRRVMIAEDSLSSIFQEGQIVLKIAFKMEIENLLTSEIMQILPIDFSRKIAYEMLNPEMELVGSYGAAGTAEAENVYASHSVVHMPEDELPSSSYPPAPQADIPAQPSAPQAAPQTQASAPQAPVYPPEPAIPAYTMPIQGQQPPAPGYYPYPYPPYGYPPQDPAYGYPPAYPPQAPMAPNGQANGRPQAAGNALRSAAGANVKDVEYPAFGSMGPTSEGRVETNNLWRLLDVPMEVTVELGRCTKTIKQVLDMNVGSVIVLDKLAGEMVEILVNGIQVARGEVVVIDDSYGVRITELNAAELSELTRGG